MGVAYLSKNRLKISLSTYSLLILFLPVALFVRISNILNKKVFIAVSADCDLTGDATKDGLSVKKTHEIFSAMSHPSSFTWFLNEADDGWSSRNKKFLSYIKKEGYDIQLHSHFIEKYWNKKGTIPKDKEITKVLKNDKLKLEKALKLKVDGFRAGKHMLPCDMSILKKAGFVFDASTYPGLSVNVGKGDSCDYSDVHFEDNWKKPATGFISFPNHLFYPPKTFLQCIVSKNKGPLVISYLFHPYELVSENGITRFRVFMLRAQFAMLKLFFPRSEFKSFKELNKLLTK